MPLDDNLNFSIDAYTLALLTIAPPPTIIVLTQALSIEGDGACCS